MKKLAGIVVMSLLAFVSCKEDVKTPEVVTPEVVTTIETAPEVPKVQTIALEQISGEFTQKELVLEEGTYIFEIANKDVDHEVGFVLAPKERQMQQTILKQLM